MKRSGLPNLTRCETTIHLPCFGLEQEGRRALFSGRMFCLFSVAFDGRRGQSSFSILFVPSLRRSVMSNCLLAVCLSVPRCTGTILYVAVTLDIVCLGLFLLIYYFCFVSRRCPFSIKQPTGEGGNSWLYQIQFRGFLYTKYRRYCGTFCFGLGSVVGDTGLY